MTWTTTDDNGAFRATAGPFLRERPDEHTVLISLAASLHDVGPDRYGDQPPRYGWWRGPDGAVSGAFVWTPPYPVQLSPMAPAVAADLAARLLDGSGQLVGVGGQQAAAEAFAARWARATGGAWRVTGRQRLYRLGALVPPSPMPPGRARRATREDRGFLLGWFEAYHRDLGEDPADSQRALDDRLGYGGCALWEVDGVPVSMASVTRASGGMARVNGVYTPDALRGKGYAGAVVTAVSREALDAGVPRVLLFADVANPTSNALYQRLGYRVVGSHATLALDPAPAHARPDGRA
ncbi:GNAT family N-acetyltransferase [Streptomyces sp. AC563]|uniref:GNAT family N-acetyltransferase n=1 Tax=Streptomyces buecherae TaxID=2763006 RepID=UPI00164DC453|nr:GNAT family N-acetyltransferase [Streptomyces buecherae]MBC3988599.1 GNAT family N-acetyltransferase [Streptomyces buecherae]